MFKTTLKASLALVAGLAMSACDGASSDQGTGGVSEGEARALDEAAEMLDAKRLPEGVLPDVDAPPPAPEPTDGDD